MLYWSLFVFHWLHSKHYPVMTLLCVRWKRISLGEWKPLVHSPAPPPPCQNRVLFHIPEKKKQKKLGGEILLSATQTAPTHQRRKMFDSLFRFATWLKGLSVNQDLIRPLLANTKFARAWNFILLDPCHDYLIPRGIMRRARPDLRQ